MEDKNLCSDPILSESPPFSSDLELGCTRRILILQTPCRSTVGWVQMIQRVPPTSLSCGLPSA